MADLVDGDRAEVSETLEIPGPGGPLGWVVVDSSVGGLSFGGLRIHPGVERAEVADLARVMTWKLAGQGFPVGGAKAGLRADPNDPALPSLLKRFAEGAGRLLNASVILGRDMGASDAALDALYSALGRSQLSLANPTARNVSRIRELPGYRVGMAGAAALEAAKAVGFAASSPRVLIQGFGSVGRGVAKAFAAAGARIVGVSDVTGCYSSPDGFELETLLQNAPNGRVSNCRKSGRPEELFAVPADVLVLAAMSRTVDASAAESVAAPLVIEASNFGLTADGRSTLDRRALTVIPDVIASSSAAGLVARHLAARAALDGESAWKDTLAAVGAATRAALADSKKRGVSVRRAHVDLNLAAVRAKSPDAKSELP